MSFLTLFAFAPAQLIPPPGLVTMDLFTPAMNDSAGVSCVPHALAGALHS